MALLQSTVPRHQQGRALSLLMAVMALGAPVGLALASPLGELIGMRWLFVLLGILSGFVSLLGFRSGNLLRFGGQSG
ncbi:MFS transporter (plasmid) [Roseomonas sp. OT10]|nr:MFS transporter [Roseomonas sp. OT10]UFN51638.1 MFS transporter [Roseomonas sp. OT10]